MKIYDLSLFIFRRDLRLFDNTALNSALEQSRQVLACFIFDPKQIEPHPYQSIPGFQFMLEALIDLQTEVSLNKGQLFFFKNAPDQIVADLQLELRIQAVFVNRDYTPFSRERDAKLENACINLGLDYHQYAIK
jgi:deoxyribodipyrimidine photo-lyase